MRRRNRQKYQAIGESEGFDRYELFVDAKDISSNNGEIATAEYNKLLIERGNEKIAEKNFYRVILWRSRNYINL